MNISSTPFIRNDYWPDYNDINQLNQRIDEVENEISLVNIRLSNDIENVSNNLNTYVNDQANTTITNNLIVNNLNANYAEGRFANFDNTFTNNAYIENLTVNKPVFDITLNTPHLENTTSLNGNFYSPNLIGAKFSGDISGDLNVVNVNQLNVIDATIANLFVNTSVDPVQSSAVLGYDSEGRVIPIHATFDVGFPEDADYLFTDHAGTAFAGTAATEVDTSSNLITSHGVKNAIDALNTNVFDNFNLINSALNDIDEWENSFENSVANSFNDVANTFNSVNNDVANTFNDVNNFVSDSLNDVNNTFNDVNNYVSDNFNNFNNNFSNIDNNFVNADNNFVNAFNNFNEVYDILSTLMSFSTSNASYWKANDTFVNTFETIRFATPADTTGVNISTGAANAVYAKVSGTELVFSSNLPILNTNQSMLRVFNTNMDRTFSLCRNLNQNILIPNGVVDMSFTFHACENLNQNILIPNGVVGMGMTFSKCRYLNQNILIPNSVTDITSVFTDCYNLNQNILIPNSVTGMDQVFSNCIRLNQNILIPNSVTNMFRTFYDCENLNQNILIPNSVTNMVGVFTNCYNLNQNDMYIYSQNINSFRGKIHPEPAFGNVQYIGNIHVPTSVPKDTSNFMYNSLVNGAAGYTFAPENIINDLPVDIAVWPPES